MHDAARTGDVARVQRLAQHNPALKTYARTVQLHLLSANVIAVLCMNTLQLRRPVFQEYYAFVMDCWSLLLW